MNITLHLTFETCGSVGVFFGVAHHLHVNSSSSVDPASPLQGSWDRLPFWPKFPFQWLTGVSYRTNWIFPGLLPRGVTSITRKEMEGGIEGGRWMQQRMNSFWSERERECVLERMCVLEREWRPQEEVCPPFVLGRTACVWGWRVCVLPTFMGLGLSLHDKGDHPAAWVGAASLRWEERQTSMRVYCEYSWLQNL